MQKKEEEEDALCNGDVQGAIERYSVKHRLKLSSGKKEFWKSIENSKKERKNNISIHCATEMSARFACIVHRNNKFEQVAR